MQTSLLKSSLTNITHILSKLENITTILDVGCGEGYYSRKIKELFQADIVAFDGTLRRRPNNESLKDIIEYIKSKNKLARFIDIDVYFNDRFNEHI